METCIPFSGFYESLWSSEIDSCQELIAESYAEERDVEQEAVDDLLYRYADYSAMHQDIAKAYAEAFGDMLGVSLTMTVMTSPKEYNFMTDRIFADISVADMAKLYRQVGKNAVREQAKKLFTSREGFISYYDPDIDTWGSVREWDYNQRLAIMQAAVERLADDDWDLSLYYDLQESIYTIYSEHVDWECIDWEIEHMEDEPDGRHYPVDISDPKVYVETFIDKNGYSK